MKRRLPAAVLLVLAPLVALHSQNPGRPDVERGISLAVAGEYEGALKLFRSELRRRPDDPLLNYYVGMTEIRLDRFSSAVFHFEKALEEKADFPQVYFWLCKAYLEKKLKQKAMDILRQGRERFPRNQDLNDLWQVLQEEP